MSEEGLEGRGALSVGHATLEQRSADGRVEGRHSRV